MTAELSKTKLPIVQRKCRLRPNGCQDRYSSKYGAKKTLTLLADVIWRLETGFAREISQ
ncbi:hypothetical protein JOC55_001936 [Paenibacillus sacheonensis]|nr:hypothetical protein [Paenibacillus sacheonensis]